MYNESPFKVPSQVNRSKITGDNIKPNLDVSPSEIRNSIEALGKSQEETKLLITALFDRLDTALATQESIPVGPSEKPEAKCPVHGQIIDKIENQLNINSGLSNLLYRIRL